MTHKQLLDVKKFLRIKGKEKKFFTCSKFWFLEKQQGSFMLLSLSFEDLGLNPQLGEKLDYEVVASAINQDLEMACLAFFF